VATIARLGTPTALGLSHVRVASYHHLIEHFLGPKALWHSMIVGYNLRFNGAPARGLPGRAFVDWNTP
jgi:hypothetical protein